MDRRKFLGAMAAAGAWSTIGVRSESFAATGRGTPTLLEVRRLAVREALEEDFLGGRFRVADRDERNDFSALLHPESLWAGLAAFEFTDADGPFAGDPRLRDHAIGAIEAVTSEYKPTGVVGHGDMNSAYFSLVPVTRALLRLEGRVDERWRRTMIDRAERLFAAAAEHVNRTHDYLNPRALEAVGALGLHRLTGDPEYRERASENLDELITRQYPSGAQPYHTGDWVWGRKPAQSYQFLTGALMLYLGREMDRLDAVDYVRRIADYALLASNRHGEAFVTTFEGLHKSRTTGSAAREWPMLAALGDERFHELARATYEIWVSEALEEGRVIHSKSGIEIPKASYLVGLNEALYLGVEEVPETGPFVPPRGLFALPDISTVFVHEPALDVSMSLMGGYSALAEADCGDVKLFAMTPELSSEPTFRNAGIDARRYDWKVPTGLLECAVENGVARLRGRVYTTYEMPASEQLYRPEGLDESRAFNRLMEISMTYSDGEMLLEYETVENPVEQPIPSRLLFLLIARPAGAPPRLQVGNALDTRIPSADSEETYYREARLDRVRFSAHSGSAIEIVPESSLAEKITAERPGEQWVQDRATRRVRVKQANEGSLRLAFEGPRVLDRGRYRVRFLPGGGK